VSIPNGLRANFSSNRGHAKGMFTATEMKSTEVKYDVCILFYFVSSFYCTCSWV